MFTLPPWYDVATIALLQPAIVFCNQSSAASAMSTPTVPTPQQPRAMRGNTGEIQWEYHTLTRVYIQQTPRLYYTTWYDRELRRLRPVLWQCIYVNTDSPREVVETWYWTYVGGL